MYKTILIDLDDTLWATQQNNKEAIHELYHSEGWSSGYASFDDFWQQYYPNNEELWRLYRHGAITKHELTLRRFTQPLVGFRSYSEDEILELNKHFLYLSSHKTGLINGAIELLKYLKTLYQVVIISNGFIEVQHCKLEVSGLAPYIDQVVLSEQIGVSKPYKEIFDYALSKTHTRRDEAIMVGDSWDADIQGAQNAKLPSIWFNPSNLPMPQEELRYPVQVATHLSDIPSQLWR